MSYDGQVSFMLTPDFIAEWAGLGGGIAIDG